MERKVRETLRDRRVQMGLTQRDLAAEMGGGVTQSMISDWETGLVSVTLKNLDRWASTLEASIGIHIED